MPSKKAAVGDMLTAALSYASRGVRVFPTWWTGKNRCGCPAGAECTSPGKHPLTDRGFMDASADESAVQEWWTRWPRAGIATPTGTTDGFDVLDVDPRNGGEESFQAVRELGQVPMVLVCETGGGGQHIYLDAAHKGLRTRPFLPGLDWKTTGGYVILPPTLHRSGKRYAWANGAVLGETTLPPVPGWLVDFIREHQDERPQRDLAGNGDRPRDDHDGVERPPVPEGSRHDWMTRRAGILLNAGLRGDVLLAALLELSRTRCTPPLPDDEVARIAEDASTRWTAHEGFRLGAPKATAPRPQILVEPYEDFHARVAALPPIRPLIGELVTEESMVLVHGQPREGKTFTVMELTASAVTATPAFGLERFAVDAPIPTLFVHEEDPERHIHSRFELLWAGRGMRPQPGMLFVAVRKGVFLDDPGTQNFLIELAKRHGVRLTTLDPLRALSACVDQGPRELQPLAEFFRRFVGETGSALLGAHHDVKPDRKQQDDRKRPQRASGGGIFSVMDSPIHVERFGTDSSLVVPSGFKHSSAGDPAPFSYRMVSEGDGLRLVGEDTTAASASELEVHSKIVTFLQQHPDSSTNAVAKMLGRSGERTISVLRELEERDLVLSRPGRNRAVHWSLETT